MSTDILQASEFEARRVAAGGSAHAPVALATLGGTQTPGTPVHAGPAALRVSGAAQTSVVGQADVS